jgi:hypothetical protein
MALSLRDRLLGRTQGASSDDPPRSLRLATGGAAAPAPYARGRRAAGGNAPGRRHSGSANAARRRGPGVDLGPIGATP